MVILVSTATLSFFHQIFKILILFVLYFKNYKRSMLSLNCKKCSACQDLQKVPQLKMSDNCVKSYSSWNTFYCWHSLLLVTQIIKGKQLYYKMWSSKSKILRIIDIYVFLQQCWLFTLKGEPLPKYFGEGICNDDGYICYFFYRSYQVLLTDVVIIPRWAIQAPGIL
jgi:hypothetical protein